ncbi:tol-pal system-associated acyl-CoA thioesterase [Chenggangzhangella methanolivorans]|uniref:Tol-pal system-associated acyl-CoA thioesterase n=2 Tax=Chenggangzhangella methanolivorans TaxID=1437009 RepID=A0A9E6URI0_9HYPH|nr:tol-pal system-associated acyl-CoA thioesterase [Chenggangzhangella methanolivorans]
MEGVRHILTLRVYYEDTDFSGFVYHASYLRFMERARTEILRAIEFDHRRLWDEKREGFVVRRMTIDYLRPAMMDDVIAVTTTAEDVKAASLVLRQTVTRDDDVLVAATAQCAYLRDGRPARMPDRMRREMMRTE